MIGLNPWQLSRDKFCFIWLESSNCSCRDVLDKGVSIKGSVIDSIVAFKVVMDGEGEAKIVGQWFGKFRRNYEPITGLLEFIKDGYLVSLHGDEYVFRVVDECLERNQLSPLNREYTMDIGEVFGWVEDEEWVRTKIKAIEEIYWKEGNAREKLMAIIGWFGENMMPLLRNGFR